LSTGDVPRAHALLAAIQPTGGDEGLLLRILPALLTGAGQDRGAAIDAAHPERPFSLGLTLTPSELHRLSEELVAERKNEGALATSTAATFFGNARPAGDPRVIPITAGDDTLAILVLAEPPADPAGFASVVAHAASILAWVRMAEKVREADFELKYRVWELESLYDVGLSIAGTLDLESLADDILMKSVSLLNARSGALIVRRKTGDGGLYVKEFGSAFPEPGGSGELPQEVSIANRREDRPPVLAGATAEKLLAVPIRSQGEPIGILVVGDKENRGGGIDDFDRNDARILSLFGNQAAIALENARLHAEALEKERMDREIELAASIQRTILPASLPEVEGLEICGSNRPTRQVGGDFYDVFPLPGGRVAFALADVSGKGVPAALLVSTVHACLHLLFDTGREDLPFMIARVNEHLVRFSSTRKFATMFLGIFDPSTREVRYVNAGHNPGILAATGSLELLGPSGVPVGMFKDAVHREEVRTLRPGDLLVLYSDGITEAQDSAEEEFGMERLIALVEGGLESTPAGLTAAIFGAVDEFTRGVAQYDDQTVLVARIR
jgi:sigma-B regulation protein RsbU (phosphoserine phosphatase)